MLDAYRVPSPPDGLKIVVRSLLELKPNPSNARTHSRRQIGQIADSIAQFGFNNPVLIDEDDLIIAGHGRVEAAKLLGITEVPTVCLAHMSKAQKRAYVIADNRLAEKAGWDKDILAIEFETLLELAPELDSYRYRLRVRRDRPHSSGGRAGGSGRPRRRGAARP